MTINNFSPNMLKTYQACPKKFFYKYIEQVHIPLSSTPFEKGKKIHALANYFLQGVNITRLESALTEREREVWNSLLNNPFFQKKCYQSEYQLSCKISEYWIGGRLDAVVLDGEDYYILDYKTGAVPQNPQDDVQTMIYLLCLDRFLKGKYNTLTFVYINLKDKKNHVIEFNEVLKQKYEFQIEEICTTIITDKIFECNIERCACCEYKILCNKY